MKPMWIVGSDEYGYETFADYDKAIVFYNNACDYELEECLEDGEVEDGIHDVILAKGIKFTHPVVTDVTETNICWDWVEESDGE